MNWRVSPEYANSKVFFDMAYRREVRATGRHTEKMCEVSIMKDPACFAPGPVGHVYWADKDTLEPIVYAA